VPPLQLVHPLSILSVVANRPILRLPVPCNVGVVTSIETVVRFITAMDGRDVAAVRELADEEIEIVGSETAGGIEEVARVAGRAPEPVEETTEVLEWTQRRDCVLVKARRRLRWLGCDEPPHEELVSGVFVLGSDGRIRHVRLFDDAEGAWGYAP
jgi:limonene-1,2-epoxide hydrolase